MATLCKNLSHISSSSRHHLLVVTILRFSTAAVTGAQDPPPKTPPFILQYLIDSCGFSPDRAATTSKHIAHIKSPSNPDSVIRLLKETGLDDAHIRDVISNNPQVLYSKVEPTLKAKLRALLDLGFSESELPRLIRLSPKTLTLRDMKPKLQFWRGFYPTNEALFKAMKMNPYLLAISMERVVPNITLLQDCSLSNDQIAKMILKASGVVSRKLDFLQTLVQQAKELESPPGSNAFFYAFCALSCISQAKIESKTRLLESLGFSKDVIKSRPQSMASLLVVSEKKMINNLDFLIKKAGCDPSYIIFRPSLVQYSLAKRLIPRYRVLQTLKLKGLTQGGGDLYSAMTITEKKFIDKYVLPHKEAIPELHQAYIATCTGKDALSNC